MSAARTAERRIERLFLHFLVKESPITATATVVFVGNDFVTLFCAEYGVEERLFSDEIKVLEQRIRAIRRSLKENLGVPVNVVLGEGGQRGEALGEHTAQRFEDVRLGREQVLVEVVLAGAPAAERELAAEQRGVGDALDRGYLNITSMIEQIPLHITCAAIGHFPAYLTAKMRR